MARALWDEYPTDTIAWAIDRQFLWGSGLLISPVLDQGAETVEAYFPDARWYDITYWTRTNVITEMTTRGGFETLSEPFFMALPAIEIHKLKYSPCFSLSKTRCSTGNHSPSCTWWRDLPMSAGGHNNNRKQK